MCSDVAEYKSQKHDNSSRHHKLSKSPQREEARRERQPSFSPPPVPDTTTQISPRDNEAYDPTSGFVDDEVEEGTISCSSLLSRRRYHGQYDGHDGVCLLRNNQSRTFFFLELKFRENMWPTTTVL